jgi:hypothetical protein
LGKNIIGLEGLESEKTGENRRLGTIFFFSRPNNTLGVRPGFPCSYSPKTFSAESISKKPYWLYWMEFAKT